MNIYILLWFEAPLQSWGFDSKFGRRDTLAFPTKSGVLGLVCSALGAGGAQRELLAEFTPLRQTAISFARYRQKEDEVVKQDREPLLRDFHMVGAGYDDKDPWASLLIPKTSEGKKAVGGGTKMTYRYYLQDAAFAVALEVPGDKAESIAEAAPAGHCHRRNDYRSWHQPRTKQASPWQCQGRSTQIYGWYG